jgi:hypothetical protein
MQISESHLRSLIRDILEENKNLNISIGDIIIGSPTLFLGQNNQDENQKYKVVDNSYYHEEYKGGNVVDKFNAIIAKKITDDGLDTDDDDEYMFEYHNCKRISN